MRDTLVNLDEAIPEHKLPLRGRKELKRSLEQCLVSRVIIVNDPWTTCVLVARHGGKSFLGLGAAKRWVKKDDPDPSLGEEIACGRALACLVKVVEASKSGEADYLLTRARTAAQRQSTKERTVQ